MTLSTLFAAVLAASVGAFAVPADAKLKLGKIGKLDAGTWVPNNGDLVLRRDLCVETSKAKSNSPRAPGYAIRVDADSATPGLYAVTGNNQQIPLSLLWQDLRTGASHNLQPAVITSATLTGGNKKCPGGVNARLQLRLAAADLGAVPPGQYQARMQAAATSDDGKDEDKVNIDLRITIPEVISLSDVDNLNLGLFDRVNDAVATDRLCVFRNGASGSYTLAASGTGPGGSFGLAGPGATVPLQLAWDDGAGWTALAANATASTFTGANGKMVNCGGAGSASVRATVLAADLEGKATGSYSGTITLRVAPL